MQSYIVLREIQNADSLLLQEVIKQAIMLNVSTAFKACLLKEITLQLVVLCSALMFIFIGVPIMYCIMTLPAVLGFNYLCIYLSHLSKAMELSVANYSKTWVAETFEPIFSLRHPSAVHYVILTGKQANTHNFQINEYTNKIVGTISLTTHNALHNAAWLSRIAILERYKHKGIAHALVNVALEYCRNNNISSAEVATTECQEGARQMFINLGFTIRQIYHKQIIGSALTMTKYQLGFDTLNLC